MVTISKIVEEYIKQHSFLQEALSRGILNYAALAEQLKSKVEISLNCKVKESAIMMALRRQKEKLHKTFVEEIRFSEEADIFLKSDLFEVTYKKSAQVNENLKKIYDLIKAEHDFLTVTEGLHQITIISNKRNKKIILSTLKHEKMIKTIDGLACVSTILPDKSTEEVGYFYAITRAFSWEQIPIVEIVSTLHELNFIVFESDAPRAFVAFKEVISKQTSANKD
jgi:hypothetical protein